MTVLSKLVGPCLKLSCYEVGHTLEPSCLLSAVKLSGLGIWGALKVYSVLYLFSALFRGNVNAILAYLKRNFLVETVRSSLFLGLNCSGFMGMFCILSKLTGGVYSWTFFVAGFIASLAVIHIERESKRPALASYMSLLAAECIYNTLKLRGIISAVPYGDVLIFCSALAWLSLLNSRPSAATTGSTATYVIGLLSSTPANKRWMKILTSLTASKPPERVEVGSAMSILDGVLRGSLIGFALELFRFIRSSKMHRQFSPSLGIFLGVLAGLFRLLRRYLPSSSSGQATAAFLSGISLLLYRKPSSIPSYLLFKAAQLEYMGQFIENPALSAKFRQMASWGVSVIYALSTATILHQGCYQGHSIRLSYIYWLMQLTGGWIGELNRRLLVGIQPDAGRVVPDLTSQTWWPKYDPVKSTLWTGPTEHPESVVSRFLK